MNTKHAKWLIGLSAAVLMALSAAPALARFIEPGMANSVTRWNESAQTAAAVPAVAPVAVTTEDRSGRPEAEKSAAAQPDTSAPAIAAPSDPSPATQIEIEHGPEIAIKGTVQSISGTSPALTLLVGNRVVTTTAQTVFLDPIAVGNFIEVNGFLQADQSVWARQLKLDGNPLVELEVEFRGAITALPADPNWLGQWVVGPYTIIVDGSTHLDTRRGQPALGAIAEVKAFRQPDNSLLASRVKIEDAGAFQNEAEFKGVISDLTGSGPYTMLVAGRAVTTDNRTVIDGPLANGLFVEVGGSLQANGTVLAARIHIEDPVNNELQFKAHVTAVPAGFIGVWTFDNGQTVTADANTLIDQSRGAAQVGALVEVTALKHADNSWLAVRLQVEDD